MAESSEIDELTQDDGYLKKTQGGHYQLRQEVYELLRFHGIDFIMILKIL